MPIDTFIKTSMVEIDSGRRGSPAESSGSSFSLESLGIEDCNISPHSSITSTSSHRPPSRFEHNSSPSPSSNPSKFHKSPTLICETQRTFRDIRKKKPELCLNLFKDGQYSLHHKISQSQIKTAFNIWLNDNKPDGSFKNAIAICEKCTGVFELQALLNAPFNVELGPNIQYREADPGFKFDPSYIGNGQMTPRSKAMQEVLYKKPGKAHIPIYESIGSAFLAAYNVHVNELCLPNSELSTPVLTQWKKKDNGKWVKSSK